MTIGVLTSAGPLTLTLSPEGRGDAGGGAGETHHTAQLTGHITSPLRGEVAAQRRVRGPRAKPAQIDRARILRSSMTDAENRLWYHLRHRRLAGFKFVRQFPVAGYYADFACREAMLVIEADGGQHEAERDKTRDRAIKAAGYAVLRFWNNDILSNTSGVLETIIDALGPVIPSPLRGEGQGEGPTSSHRISE